jgi:transcriptional regulator with XRE-family HTH domain
LNRRYSLPSELGRLIASTRKARGLGLRALARKVGRSPSFLVMIEKADPAPGVAEETLRRIAAALDLDADRLVTLAGKTPDDVVPADEVEVAIYRLVKRLPADRRLRLLRQLERTVGQA